MRRVYWERGLFVKLEVLLLYLRTEIKFLSVIIKFQIGFIFPYVLCLMGSY